MSNDRLLTFPEIEREVISNILTCPELFYEAQGTINDDAFTDIHCRNVWRIITQRERKGESYDLIAVAPTYSECGMDISTFLEYFQGGTTVEFSRNIVILSEYSYRRRLSLELQKLSTEITDPSNEIGDLQAKGFDIFNSLDNINIDDSYTCIANVSQKLVEAAISRSNGKGGTTTLKTGFKLLDGACGLKAGHLMVIAAESSMGKTSFATDIAVNVALDGESVLFFSLEMNDREVVSRVMARYADLKSGFITDGVMMESQIDRLKEAASAMSGMKLYFDDKERFNVGRMCSSIRRAAKKKGVRLVIVDYLQIFGQSGSVNQTKNDFYGEVTRRFKNLAEELQITIILVSQLNRSKDHPIPTLSRLRGSGEIEENANEIVFVYRPERLIDAGVTSYPDQFVNEPIRGTAMIILAKCRGGECGKAILNFDGRTTHFYERDKEPPKTYVDINPQKEEEVLPF